MLVCDAGNPRNAAAAAMHGYLSRDGLNLHDLLRIGREQLALYGVEIRRDTVTERAAPPADGPALATRFEVLIGDGSRLASRKLLLATGVVDELPDVEGVRPLYGRSVHHCPYCDGWEHRDQHLIAFGPAPRPPAWQALRTWSDRVTACTDGQSLGGDDRRRLGAQRRGGAGGARAAARGARRRAAGAGRVRRRTAARVRRAFFNTRHGPRCELAGRLGCEYDEQGHVRTTAKQRTFVPGLFLAGDADGDVQFVIVAAAEGATAAVAINRELQDEDRGQTRPTPQAAGRVAAF